MKLSRVFFFFLTPPNVENKDPIKITWKRLETAYNDFWTLEECINKQHDFLLRIVCFVPGERKALRLLHIESAYYGHFLWSQLSVRMYCTMVI